jgi:hypothetical protein
VSLRRTGFIPLPRGREAGFDHADVRLADDAVRMYVAHTGADRVDVIDCRSGEYLGSIEDLPGVAGVLVDQGHDLLFTSDRGCARVSVFRCSDEALIGRVGMDAREAGRDTSVARGGRAWSAPGGGGEGAISAAAIASFVRPGLRAHVSLGDHAVSRTNRIIRRGLLVPFSAN